MRKSNFTLALCGALALVALAGCTLPPTKNVVTKIDTASTLFEQKDYHIAFAVPANWKFVPRQSETQALGDFIDNSDEIKASLEIPFIGSLFSLYGDNTGSTRYESRPKSANLPVEVVLASSTLIITNDADTPVAYELYRPCLKNMPGCKPAPHGGFVVAYWDRQSATPVLTSDSILNSNSVGVIIVPLSGDEGTEYKEQAVFEQLVKTIRFTDIPTTTLETTDDTNVKTYSNSDYQYTLSYPSDFILNKNAKLDAWSLDSGPKFNFPDSYLNGTNLHEAFIAVSTVVPELMQTNCSVPPTNDDETTELINGIPFTVSSGVDAGAGNYYENVTYAAERNNMCLHIMLGLHSVNRDNYDAAARPKEFDRKKIMTVFKNFLQSFHYTNR